MKPTLLVALLGLSLSACIAIPVSSEGSAASSNHPHGGPPGQMKKEGHSSHHGNCGHKHKNHKGSDVYYVNGAWMTSGGVVVVVD